MTYNVYTPHGNRGVRNPDRFMQKDQNKQYCFTALSLITVCLGCRGLANLVIFRARPTCAPCTPSAATHISGSLSDSRTSVMWAEEPAGSLCLHAMHMWAFSNSCCSHVGGLCHVLLALGFPRRSVMFIHSSCQCGDSKQASLDSSEPHTCVFMWSTGSLATLCIHIKHWISLIKQLSLTSKVPSHV